MQHTGKMYLQVSLKLPDVCGFTVQNLLREDAHQGILPIILMQVLETLDHGSCVALNYNFRNFGIRMVTVQTEPDHSIL